MKTVKWTFVLGLGSGAKAGIIGALAYVATHAILSFAFGTRTSGSIIFWTLVSLLYGAVIGSVLGTIMGGVSGFVLALLKTARLAPIIGIIFGGLTGWLLGIAPPFTPETGTFADPVALQWYHMLTRLLATLCGALGGFLGGRHFWTSFRKRVT